MTNSSDKPRAEGSGYPFKATDEQRRSVETMTAYGAPQSEVCRALKIDKKTLAKHFRAELDQAVDRANVKIAETLYKLALGGPDRPPNVGACIFWLKARAGWRERHEITGPDGGAVPLGTITVVHVSPKKK